MNKKTIQDMIQIISKFCKDRDWDKFHTAKDLAIGISTEANELLDIFRFKSETQINKLFENTDFKKRVENELADTLFFLLRFADKFNIDLDDALDSKILSNSKKYPISKSKGVNLKYNEY
ncbi:nucleotide pyrophosphohydrolase [Mycoplasma sp. Mirounga ES2805-ORL]|uniref:nucleotide pyrophosphohydrolase n=1 Tax=Mycoplasma sp. Mirounga ES2805-ORL TaxID=754514 RepID=UPI00197B2E5A|nr:nucleotide pyrophosphohydrolase [Mycoplasma sp. Mirounga ES2805-ORL]QSF13752.1 nucleotide pyrophosphohydrolase [Mycoplasma sp. Mirounga ES2805-ORL]